MKLLKTTPAAVILCLLVSACGGGTAVTTADSVASSAATSPPTTERSDAPVTLNAPAEVGSGTDFVVSWTGPNNDSDYITIVPASAAEGAYLDYFYSANGPEGSLVAPNQPGQYEIRYVDGDSEKTTFSVPLLVVPSKAEITAAATVEAGTVFEISWTGPDGPDDYVTLVEAGAAASVYTDYFYTREGAEGELVAPIKEGRYELRYVSGQDGKVLATKTIEVTPYVVTLEVPVSVAAGTEFEVAWTGPNGPRDYITIVPAGSPIGTYLDYEYVSGGSPIKLVAPDEPGEYEVRYASDREPSITFAAIEISVTPF